MEYVTIAACLVEALDGLKAARKGVRRKVRYGTMYVEIGAYVCEGDSGGCGHGAALVPVATGLRIIVVAEKMIRAELKALGVRT